MKKSIQFLKELFKELEEDDPRFVKQIYFVLGGVLLVAGILIGA